MAKASRKAEQENIDLDPDGWDRFQDTMNKIVPPRRREPKKA